jgi:hypothetical protein
VIRALIVIVFWGAIVIAGLAYLPWWAGASAVICGLLYAAYRISQDRDAPGPDTAPHPEPPEWQPRPRTRDPGSPE